MPNRGTSCTNLKARHLLNLHMGHGKQTEAGQRLQVKLRVSIKAHSAKKNKNATTVPNALYANLKNVLELQGKYSAKLR